MFSNGKFKNVVSMLNPKEDCPIPPGNSLEKLYTLLPIKGTTKNWIALEESYTKSGTSLASTVTSTVSNIGLTFLFKYKWKCNLQFKVNVRNFNLSIYQLRWF